MRAPRITEHAGASCSPRRAHPALTDNRRVGRSSLTWVRAVPGTTSAEAVVASRSDCCQSKQRWPASSGTATRAFRGFSVSAGCGTALRAGSIPVPAFSLDLVLCPSGHDVNAGALTSRPSCPRPTGRTLSKQPCNGRGLSAAGELGGAAVIAAPTNTLGVRGAAATLNSDTGDGPQRSTGERPDLRRVLTLLLPLFAARFCSGSSPSSFAGHPGRQT